MEDIGTECGKCSLVRGNEIMGLYSSSTCGVVSLQ